MHDQDFLFLKTLFANCTTGYLTLSAIHPDGKHATPSRHIPVHDETGLLIALRDLLKANEQGWGAFFGVATRQADLGRWRRGGQSDVSELPALFVDLDIPVAEAMRRLRAHDPPSSCVVASGGGVHAYWFLDQPTSDWDRAAHALQHLRQRLGSDRSCDSQLLRLPGSLNTKPSRHNAPCHLLELSSSRYPLATLLDASPFKQDLRFRVETPPRSDASSSAVRGMVSPSAGHRSSLTHSFNPRLIAAVQQGLEDQYSGCWQRNGWLAALCPCGHQRDRPGMHFAFNPLSGVGVCLGRHGRLLLKDLCCLLHLQPSDYGGFYSTRDVKQNH